jgi:hypothetical protein
MKRLLICICLFALPLLGISQDKSSIVMNDPLIKEYFGDFLQEAADRGFDVEDQLMENINYILIVPEDQDNVKYLAEFDEDIKFIKLSSKVKIDRLILKINLYRELSHVLGIPYDQGSVIMYREHKKGFSYAFADDIDIMDIEMDKVLAAM